MSLEKHSRMQKNRAHKKHAGNGEEGGDDDDKDDAAMAAASAVSAPALIPSSFPSSSMEHAMAHQQPPTSRPPLMSKNSSNVGGGTFELPPMPMPFEGESMRFWRHEWQT